MGKGCVNVHERPKGCECVEVVEESSKRNINWRIKTTIMGGVCIWV